MDVIPSESDTRKVNVYGGSVGLDGFPFKIVIVGAASAYTQTGLAKAMHNAAIAPKIVSFFINLSPHHASSPRKYLVVTALLTSASISSIL